jgi:hypothetical protein
MGKVMLNSFGGSFQPFWASPLSANNGCGIPVDCCCHAGSYTVDLNSLLYRSIMLDYIFEAQEKASNIRYDITDVLEFSIFNSATNTTYPTPPLALPINLASITPTTPLVVGTDFEIQEILLYDGKNNNVRALRLHIKTYNTATVGNQYQIKFKLRAKSLCSNLIIEKADCAFLTIGACGTI